MPTISTTRSACALGAALIFVAAASWLATGAFPLAAAPQVMDDAAGVTVNLNGSRLLHRSPVNYPAAALATGIEGTVVVQMKLDAAGEVSDAAVLSGPDELRKSVLQSVLSWHFDRSEALTTQTVNIGFVKPAVASPAAPQFIPASRQIPQAAASKLASPPPPSGKLDRIVVTGLSDSTRSELLSRLPVHEGGEWTGQAFAAVRAAVAAFDSHLTTSLIMSPAGAVELRIGLANTGGSAGAIPSPALTSPPPQGVFSVGNGVSAPAVISKVDPQYSPEALTAKYAGSVMLSVVINTEGQADDIRIVKSLGLGLDEKAVEAVRQWRFRPGMNSGVPVSVRAQIEVNFRLPPG